MSIFQCIRLVVLARQAIGILTKDSAGAGQKPVLLPFDLQEE